MEERLIGDEMTKKEFEENYCNKSHIKLPNQEKKEFMEILDDKDDVGMDGILGN